MSAGPGTLADIAPAAAPRAERRPATWASAIRVKPGVGVTTLVSIVLAITVASSFGAILTAREIERRMAAVVSDNVPGVTAAAELQNALMQQRGLVAAYMLDDGQLAWVNDLDKIKPNLAHWLGEAKRTARTDEERNLLAQLTNVYAAYDAERERAITLYHDGHAREARDVLLGDVSRLSDQAYGLCRDFSAANQRFMNTSLARGRERVASLVVALPVLMGLSTLLCLGVLFIVSRRLLRPMRRLAHDARAFSASETNGHAGRFEDDMRELEFYSRAIMSDATRTRARLAENQQKLTTAEKLAAVGQFSACAAHELRSPLSAIKMWLYELRRSAGDPEAVVQTCIVLEEETSRLEELATNFLQYSKPPELNPRRLTLDDILDGTLALGHHRLDEKRIRVIRERRLGMPHVRADANQLRQVLLNLISNAAEATPEGGELRISESVEVDAEGREQVVLRIRDSGPGVPESIRDRLFEPFVTTKARGTGLGLSVASSIVARHGGRLELEAHDAPGAVFAIRLPACGD